MKSILITAVIFLAANVAMAKSPPAPSLKTISCTVMEDDDTTGGSKNVARVIVSLDSKGVASSIRLERLLAKGQSSNFLPSDLDMNFDNVRDLVTHGVRPNKVVDHDGDKLVFDWSIPRVEFVEAISQSGNSIDLSINDHTYSGVPGTTVIYKKDGKSYNSADAGATTLCTGAMKLPFK